MLKKERKKRVRKHWIMNRPILAMVLILILNMILSAVLSPLIADPVETDALTAEELLASTMQESQDPKTQLVTIFSSLLILLFFAFWFREEYSWKNRAGVFRTGFLLTAPLFVIVAMNLFGAESFVTGKQIIAAILCGIAPGLSEEVLIRGVNIPNWMRLHREELRKIPFIVIFTSAFFAVAHLMNILVGAGTAMTLIQVGYAFGIGAIFASCYLRTGSLLWPVLMHSMIDITAFLHTEVFETGGVLVGDEVVLDWSVVVLGVETLILIFLAFYYIRPSKRAEIAEIWAEKWKVRNGTDEEETAGIETAERKEILTEESAEGVKVSGEAKEDGE